MKKLLCLLFGLILTGSCFACETHYLNFSMPCETSKDLKYNYPIPVNAILKQISISIRPNLPNLEGDTKEIISITLIDSEGIKIQDLNQFEFPMNNIKAIEGKVINLNLNNVIVKKGDQIQIRNYDTGNNENYIIAGRLQENATLIFETL